MQAVRAVAVVLLLATSARAEKVVPWEQAEQHVGEDAIVEGRVMGVHCSPLSCLLGFDPTFNRFTAVVQARSFDVLPPNELERLYTGRRVRVQGRIQTIDGKPEIVVEKPENMRVITTGRERRRESEDVSRSQVELLERIAVVLERIEETAARLAETQERVDALLAAVEEREAALAAMLVQQAAAPPPGPPEPQRWAYESLRSLKRGMSRAQVERLVGQPLHVEQTTNGGVIWYYGLDRTISFDSRGRAQAMVGFPQ